MLRAAMSEHADLTIRLGRIEEQQGLEELQRRASLALGEYNDQLEAEPDAIYLPIEQIERGEVFVREHFSGMSGEVAVRLEAADDAAQRHRLVLGRRAKLAFLIQRVARVMQRERFEACVDEERS